MSCASLTPDRDMNEVVSERTIMTLGIALIDAEPKTLEPNHSRALYAKDLSADRTHLPAMRNYILADVLPKMVVQWTPW
jgi:hypothetical protein